MAKESQARIDRSRGVSCAARDVHYVLADCDHLTRNVDPRTAVVKCLGPD